MNELSRVFPYDKRIMLNVIYDTLDTLGLQIEKANSERGTIIAASAARPPERVRIACSGVLPESGKTAVQIFPESASASGERLAGVVLEEVSATVKRTLHHRAADET